MHLASHIARTSCLAFVLSAAGTAPSRAQEVECFANETYTVAVKPYADEAGSQFAITTRTDQQAPDSCVFDTETADRILGQPGDPLWFGELTSELLIATRSTGPQGDLVVYELATGDIILDVPADEYAVEDGFLSYWQRIEAGNAQNCQQFADYKANGMGSVIAQYMVLNLGDKTMEETGERRCDAVQ